MKLKHARKVNNSLTKSLRLWINQRRHNYKGLIEYKGLINFYINYTNKLIWKN